jgi:hypothetical protein
MDQVRLIFFLYRSRGLNLIISTRFGLGFPSFKIFSMAPFYQPSQPRNARFPMSLSFTEDLTNWQKPLGRSIEDSCSIRSTFQARRSTHFLHAVLPCEVFETFLYHPWWWNLTPAFGPFFKSPNLRILIHHVRPVSYVKALIILRL